jgi:CheY-like chemotaxis protein
MDDTLFFAEEVERKTALTNPYKVLIVDDEEDVHTITELVLRDFVFESRGLELIHAHNAVEAYEIIKSDKDIALALVDVMMETDHAGLDLVVDIREKLNNKIVRIILRTGQPGQAPEERIIVDYDINDYKAKTELTATKLNTTIYASLRSYRDLMIIERNRCGLERVIRSLGNINQKLNITDISSAILFETAQVLGLNEDAAYVSVLSRHQDHSPNKYHILASIGEFDNKNGVIPAEILPLFEQALHARSSVYEGVHYVGYIREENGNENLLWAPLITPLGVS